MHFKLTSRDLRGPKIKYRQAISSPAEKGEKQSVQTVHPQSPGRAGGRQQQSCAAAGEELWQRWVMLESQMGEPVRSKMMGTEGGRLGRAARCRSSLPAHPHCG